MLVKGNKYFSYSLNEGKSFEDSGIDFAIDKILFHPVDSNRFLVYSYKSRTVVIAFEQ